MAIVRKAIVRDSDGYVINVCDCDENMGWPNEGETLIVAKENCEIGGTYNKDTETFSRAPVPEITRIQLVMMRCRTTKKVDRDNGNQEDGYLVDKTADEIKAEKTELAELLKTAHEDGDLSYEELNMRVRLNIEGY